MIGIYVVGFTASLFFIVGNVDNAVTNATIDLGFLCINVILSK